MNFTITDKNGNKRTIELTEDKEKLGGGRGQARNNKRR